MISLKWGVVHLGRSSCCGETERSVVVLAVLLVEVQTYQARVIVISVHNSLFLKVHQLLIII